MHTLIQPLRHFLKNHDDTPAFHAGYLVLTFLIAALFNIGTFAILIVLHMGLDYFKYKEKHDFTGKHALRAAVTESIVDWTLLSVALVFSVYFHHGAGLIAASGLLRSGGTLLRAAGLIIPKLEVVHHSLDVIFRPQHHLEHSRDISSYWVHAMTIHTIIIGVAVMLIVMAPAVLGIDGITFAQILREQILPWRL